jgi:hypothetical protein
MFFLRGSASQRLCVKKGQENLSSLWKILAWITLVLGVLGAFGTLLGSIFGGMDSQFWRQLGMPALIGGTAVGILGFLGILLTTVLQFVAFYAVGEVLSLFIDIEDNTRTVALSLRSLSLPSRPVESVPAPTYGQATPPPPPPSY